MIKRRQFGKKLNFAFDVSALPAYTKQDVLPLITRSLFESGTGALVGAANGFNLQTGVKYKEVLNIFDDSIILQDAACGKDPSGNTVFSQVTMTVGTIQVERSWCPADLEQKWAQILLPNGSTYEDLPQGDAIQEYLMALMQEVVEVAYWQSDTTLGNVNKNKFDGFIKLIDAGSPISATPTANITTSNVITITDEMVNLLPAKLDAKSDLMMMMGWDIMKLLLSAYFTTNNFFFDGATATPYQTGEFTLPKWGIKVKALHGLDGLDRIFLGRASNFYVGTDLENEFENWKIWYSQDDDIIRGRVKFKLGTQVAFTNEIVEYQNT